MFVQKVPKVVIVKIGNDQNEIFLYLKKFWNESIQHDYVKKGANKRYIFAG